MFAKIALVLAAVSVAQAQITIGNTAYQLVPIGTVGSGVSSLSTQSVPSSTLLLSGAAAPSASLQFLQQPSASLRLVATPGQQGQTFSFAAPQPQSQTISFAAPQPQTINFQAQAPQPQNIRISAPAPQPSTIRISAPAPQPQNIRISAPAPQPSTISFTAPKPQTVRLSAPAVETDYEEPGTPVAPYAFAFDETDEFGMNLKRQEAAENGVVTGSYSFTTPEGYTRLVTYVSDEKGFRANVQTNEPGTLTSQPADAEYQSTAQ